MSELPMVDVIRLKALPDFKLWLRFIDGREGVWDMSASLAETGPMLEPLRQPDLFARVFVEIGTPTWPNGYDVDPIHLYMRMREAEVL
jgi:hypothetical protein